MDITLAALAVECQAVCVFTHETFQLSDTSRQKQAFAAVRAFGSATVKESREANCTFLLELQEDIND